MQVRNAIRACGKRCAPYRALWTRTSPNDREADLDAHSLKSFAMIGFILLIVCAYAVSASSLPFFSGSFVADVNVNAAQRGSGQLVFEAGNAKMDARAMLNTTYLDVRCFF